MLIDEFGGRPSWSCNVSGTGESIKYPMVDAVGLLAVSCTTPTLGHFVLSKFRSHQGTKMASRRNHRSTSTISRKNRGL